MRQIDLVGQLQARSQRLLVGLKESGRLHIRLRWEGKLGPEGACERRLQRGFDAGGASGVGAFRKLLP